MVPRLLRGDETWCQGFSEPGTGSNLGVARLPGRRAPTTAGGSTARRCGRAWPSTPSAACCSPAPARPSRPTGASPRCSSTWTRRASPSGRSRRCTARRSSARSSSTTCSCPFDRTLGDEGQGWAVAMDLLPFERSTALWHRGAYLHRRSSSCSPPRRAGALRPDRGGRGVPAALRLPGPVPGHAAPAWPRASTLGPETSIDKILLATAEQAVFDLVADGLADDVLLGDDPAERAVAVRVPLLAGRHDLRRQRRDPAQHRRPPPARPREPTDDGRRRARAVRQGASSHATAPHTGRRRSTPRLDELGWRDALAADPRAAVVAAVRAPGRGRRHVVGARAVVLPARSASSSTADRRRAAPRSARVDAAGSVDGERRRRSAVWRSRGLADRDGAVVVAGDGRRGVAVVVDHRRPRRCAPVARPRPAPRPGRGHRRRRRPTLAVGRRRRVAGGRGRRPAGPRPRAGRRVADDARAGPRARRRPRPVRPADRRLPGRPPPPGRDASSPSRPPTPRSTPPGTTARRSPRRWPRPSPAAAPAPSPATASRCWPASASPPSTTCTATCGGSLVLDQLLGDARSLTRRLGDDLLAARTVPSLLPL